MAMNKKEKTALEAALTVAALRYTAVIAHDVDQPEPGSSETRKGFLVRGSAFSPYSIRAESYYSTSTSHGSGDKPDRNRSGSQGGRPLYSTAVLALRALRNTAEQDAAAVLRKIDRAIEEAEAAEAAT